MHAARAITVVPGEVSVTRDVAFWGGFFDTALAYNFGPPSHDVTAAAFRPKDNTDHVLEAFHFPLGLGIERAGSFSNTSKAPRTSVGRMPATTTT